MIIYTIGYEGLNIDSFMSLLRENGVETVVDIRELPLSRKPGFSKKVLASTLSASGFEYTHISDLGCPKPIRNQYRADGNWRRYKVGFIKHLATQGEAVKELVDLAQSSTCALLCFEADFNLCHRSLVADEVRLSYGMRVSHIQAKRFKIGVSANLALAFA